LKQRFWRELRDIANMRREAASRRLADAKEYRRVLEESYSPLALAERGQKLGELVRACQERGLAADALEQAGQVYDGLLKGIEALRAQNASQGRVIDDRRLMLLMNRIMADYGRIGGSSTPEQRGKAALRLLVATEGLARLVDAVRVKDKEGADRAAAEMMELLPAD
jgi:hypothetical protein